MKNYLSEYAVEFIVEAFLSTDDNVLVNEVTAANQEMGGYKMPMIMPPKEILKNVKCHNNSVYLVGEATEEQKKSFKNSKKKWKMF